MPKQNRPLVRDGRIQARKKRTDRSYLGAAPSSVPAADVAAEDDADTAADLVSPVAEALSASAPAPAGSPPAPAAGRLPTPVRAIQQQGVRKRREVNIQALARRDSAYALHELRRILILAVLIVVTLLVLTFFLR